MASKSQEPRKVRPAQTTRFKKRVHGTKRRKVHAPATTKLAALIGLLSKPAGATLAEITSLTGWQEHSVRGVMSGTIKKKLGHSVVSKKVGDERVYHIGGKS